MVKTWRLQPHEPDAQARLAAELGVSPVVAQLLLNRGPSRRVGGREAVSRRPAHRSAPAATLPGAAAAADRLWAAAQDRRKITVYGDYDVDGVTGTAILLQALRSARGPMSISTSRTDSMRVTA